LASARDGYYILMTIAQMIRNTDGFLLIH